VPLPYGKLGPDRDAEPPAPEDKKQKDAAPAKPKDTAEKRADAPAKKEDQKDQPPKKKPADPPDVPRIVRPRPRLKLGEPGEIRDEKQNAAGCRWVLKRCLVDTRTDDLPQPGTAVRVKNKVTASGREVGEQELVLAHDGRFRLESLLFGRSRTCGFDGRTFWKVEGSESPDILQADDLLDDPIAAWALIASALLRSPPIRQLVSDEKPLPESIRQSLGTCRLDGADKANGRPAYRLRWTDDSGREFFTWFSVVGEDYGMHVQLLKSSRGKDGRRRAVTYRGLAQSAGFALPMPERVVEGLDEQAVLTMVSASVQQEKLPAADLWKMPTEGEDEE